MLILTDECKKKVEEKWGSDIRDNCLVVFKDIMQQHPDLAPDLQVRFAIEIGLIRGNTITPKGFVSAVEFMLGPWF